MTNYSQHLAPDNSVQSRAVFWFFCLAAALILCGLGLRDPWPADEPRFALIAKEMVDSGQWFFPARGGEYYPDKPPVFMWAIALIYALSGSLTLAFLLPSALCSLLTLYLVYNIGSKLWDQRTGLIAAATLLFTFQFLIQAKSAQIDAMVTCWITIGCYGLLRFMVVDGRWRWYYLAFFFMGIGIITKGVGFLPVLMLIPYALYRRSGSATSFVTHQSGSVAKWLAGPLVMLAAIGLWLVPMLLLVHFSQDPALVQYRDNILFRQTVTRYADSWHHIKPFYYYLLSVIPAFWLPVSALLPWLLPKWRRALKQRDGRIIVPALWIVLVILFFSISPGKRGVYILPALPMLALISAPYIPELISRRWPSRVLSFLVITLSCVLLIAGLAGLAEFSFAARLETKFGVAPWAMFSALGGVSLVAFFALTGPTRWLRWPAFISLLWLFYSTWGYLLLGPVKTPLPIFNEVQKHIPENAELALVNFSEQFILFSPFSVTHFGYHTPVDKQRAAAYQWLAGGDARFVLLDRDDITGHCFDRDKSIDVGFAHRVHWVLLSAASRKPHCAPIHAEVTSFHSAMTPFRR